MIPFLAHREHLPFGARPGKRRDLHLGLKYRFGG